MSLDNHQSSPSVTQWSRFFRDTEGRIVIAQFPNWPLWAWLIATLLEHILDIGDGVTLARLISFAAIVYWAYLEIVSGVNPFRKCLGGTVLLFVLYDRLISHLMG